MAYLVDQSGNHLTDQFGNWLITDAVFNPTTLTTLAALPLPPVSLGTLVTFTATVTSSGSAATGTVNFLDGAAIIGSGVLSGVTASYSTSVLALGSHSITANYLGDGTYNPSTSAPLSYTITAAVIPSFLGPTGVGDPRAKARKAARKPFEYDRPYLAEHAEQLRRAMRRRKPIEVRQVIKAIIEQPATPPVIIEAAAPLTNVRSLKVNIMKGLYALLDEIEQELECEEEDSEMLLLS